VTGPRPTEQDRLKAALDYAQAGWPVFPQQANGKAPAISCRSSHGTEPGCAGGLRAGRARGSTTRPPTRTRSVTGGVGTRSGTSGSEPAPPGPDVLDVDVREDASRMPAYRKLQAAGLVSGERARVRTPSTGMHLYCRGTGQHGGEVHGQHIEVKAQGACVTAPPSTRAGGPPTSQPEPRRPLHRCCYRPIARCRVQSQAAAAA
jgi:hypothetical protein